MCDLMRLIFDLFFLPFTFPPLYVLPFPLFCFKLDGKFFSAMTSSYSIFVVSNQNLGVLFQDKLTRPSDLPHPDYNMC